MRLHEPRKNKRNSNLIFFPSLRASLFGVRMSSYSMTIVVVVQFDFTLMWAVRCVVRIVRFPSRIRNTYDSPSTRIHCRWLPSCRIRFDITITATTAAAIATHHNTILCCTVTNTERRRCVVHVDGSFVYSYRLQYASHRIASTREWNWIECVNMVYGIRHTLRQTSNTVSALPKSTLLLLLYSG